MYYSTEYHYYLFEWNCWNTRQCGCNADTSSHQTESSENIDGNNDQTNGHAARQPGSLLDGLNHAFKIGAHGKGDGESNGADDIVKDEKCRIDC